MIKIRENKCPILLDDRCIILSILSTHDKEIKNVIETLLSKLDVTDLSIDINRDRQSIYENYHRDVKTNSLLSNFPSLAKEWHPNKNGTLKPNMFFAGTNKKVWWKCEKGHEYTSSISARTHGSGCPYCANKKILPGYNDLQTAHPEIISLWHPLRNENIQVDMIGPHTKKKFWWLGNCGHEWKDYPSAIIKNIEKCPYCGNRIVMEGFNDLKSTDPKLVEEWDYERNGYSPAEILAGTNRKVWWKCRECGHEWQTFIQNRRDGARKNTGCPICAEKKRKQTKIKRRLSEKKTLSDANPELVKEWHPTKNTDLKPNIFAPNSHEKVWWLGSCGHEWQSVISSRYKGTGCPICKREKIAQISRKKVINIDTGEVFESVKEAAIKYECTSGCITQCCSGKTITAKGYRWKYLHDSRELT